MIGSFEALNILLFLIPGFISAGILNIIVVRKEKNDFSKVVEALIFSLVIYTIYALVFKETPVLFRDKLDKAIIFNWKSLAFLSIFSVLFPMVVGANITNDMLMKVARFLRITKNTSRSSVWLDVFYDMKRHVIINFENGRRIYGWPMYYSREPDKPYVFLYKPAWVVEDEETKEQKFIELDLEGMLITPEQKIESIEFLKE
jgi:hypothetical protein